MLILITGCLVHHCEQPKTQEIHHTKHDRDVGSSKSNRDSDRTCVPNAGRCYQALDIPAILKDRAAADEAVPGNDPLQDSGTSFRVLRRRHVDVIAKPQAAMATTGSVRKPVL
jgi:hypothetical protein